MKNSKRIGWAALLVALITLLGWPFLPHRDPLFRGKLESDWIEHLAYNDDQQVQQWRTFGPEGVQVLIRGLEKQDRPFERGYRKFYSRMPGALGRFLPDPRMDSTFGRRACIVDVISRLAKDAMPALPAMARALHDEDSNVRGIAMSFFTDTEDEKCILNRMDKKEKARLLPDFLAGMQDKDWGRRNNAAIALGFYPEESQIVVLVKALKDSSPQVRLVSTKALFHLDPQAAANAGVVPMLIQILNDPNDQIAYRGANLLGELAMEPQLAVPALIASAQGTNTLVASDSLSALGSFPNQAEAIVPVLLAAMKSPVGSLRRSSERALKRVDPEAAKKAGVK